MLQCLYRVGNQQVDNEDSIEVCHKKSRLNLAVSKMTL